MSFFSISEPGSITGAVKAVGIGIAGGMSLVLGVVGEIPLPPPGAAHTTIEAAILSAVLWMVKEQRGKAAPKEPSENSGRWRAEIGSQLAVVASTAERAESKLDAHLEAYHKKDKADAAIQASILAKLDGIGGRIDRMNTNRATGEIPRGSYDEGKDT